MRGHVRERGKGNWYAVLSVRDIREFNSGPGVKIVRKLIADKEKS
jgi:hypothetical protein